MPRIPITSIYIICEGRNTEPIYLERIKEEVEEDNFLAITIYPDKSDDKCKSEPIGLINEAIENKSNFDEIWVVYDKDGYTKHKEAFEKLEEHSGKIQLVFSSIAFETWVLLHFERCSNAFAKSKNIIQEKFTGGPKYLPSYEKKGAYDLYPLIKHKTKDALINSTWLNYIQSIKLHSEPIYEINPITTVSRLIKRLFEIKEEYHFLGTQKPLTIDSIEFHLIQNQKSLNIELTNKRDIAFTTNQLEFFLDDTFKKPIPIDSKVINPEDSQILLIDSVDFVVKFGVHVVYLASSV